jgi:hypothetical protein
MSHTRPASHHPAGPSRHRWLVLILVAPLALTACGSSAPAPPPQPNSPAHSQPAVQALSPPLLEAIGAVPSDVPLSPPLCSSSENLELANNNPTIVTPVPSALQSVESTCANYAGDDPEVMVIYNLTDDVLAISAANGTSPQIVPHFPAPDGLLPSWDDLEIDAQNQVVARQQERAAPGTYLIPVGGEAVVYINGTYPSLDVGVSVDQESSALSYGAQLLTGYVTDNLLDKVSALSYASSIADCANAAYSLWQNLNQQADAAATVVTALQTINACKSLADKVRADRDEALAAASESLYDQDLARDLNKVVDTAHASTWETEIGDLVDARAEIEDLVH